MKIDIINSGNHLEQEEFFIIIKNHRKMAKSRRRKLLRKYKKDLLKERQTINMRKAKVRKDVHSSKEDHLWDVLNSNFLDPQC